MLGRVTRTTCVSCLAMRVRHSVLNLLANRSVSLAESQHGGLSSRQGSIMRQVRVCVPTPSFTTCAILGNFSASRTLNFLITTRDTIILI